MELMITGLTCTLSDKRRMKAVLLKEVNDLQEDRACSLDDGQRTMMIAPTPQGTIQNLWKSSGTCSCSFRRFESSIAIPAAEIFTPAQRISATCCGCFSTKTVAVVDVDCRISHSSQDKTDGFNDATPVPPLRFGAAESGSTATWDDADSNDLFADAGVGITGLPRNAWSAYCDGFPIAPIYGEVAMSPP